MPPTITSIHETILYGDDALSLAKFYGGVLRLRAIGEPSEQGAAFRLPDGDAVLLIFTRQIAATPGRGVPTHGAVGPGHIAFRVADGSLTEWCAHFAAMGVGIELQRRWERGGESVYVRDPAGNSVELVTGAIWAR